MSIQFCISTPMQRGGSLSPPPPPLPLPPGLFLLPFHSKNSSQTISSARRSSARVVSPLSTIWICTQLLRSLRPFFESTCRTK